MHARGASAKGFFEVTHDVSHLTCADFLRAPGAQTPVIVRFSTVIHERGSPETLRDPRGFAVKFYTREGNFDLVGNNMPVFFIRDGMKFPDMVRLGVGGWEGVVLGLGWVGGGFFRAPFLGGRAGLERWFQGAVSWGFAPALR